jgi:RNA 3'-terminal phosphate cyclase (ATP)
VLQCILPALLVADGTTEVVVEGGTHNPMSPPFDFLARTFLPVLRRMGADVDLVLERPGFYPAGGGAVRAIVHPGALTPIELNERGARTGREGRARVAQLPGSIAKRELAVLRRKLGLDDGELRVEQVTNSVGPGNVLTLDLAFENVTEVLTGFGEITKPAERVAQEVVRAAREYLASDAPVGRHLADQLLIPLALAGGGRFRALPLTRHSVTNVEVIERFLPVRFRCEEVGGVATVEAVG